MTPQALPLRAKADATSIFEYYRKEAGTPVSLRFLAALDEALRFVSAFPAAGSPRYAAETGHTDLRVWRLKGFPFLVFYREAAAGVEVLRILHAARDTPASLRSPE